MLREIQVNPFSFASISRVYVLSRCTVSGIRHGSYISLSFVELCRFTSANETSRVFIAEEIRKGIKDPRRKFAWWLKTGEWKCANRHRASKRKKVFQTTCARSLCQKRVIPAWKKISRSTTFPSFLPAFHNGVFAYSVRVPRFSGENLGAAIILKG